MVPGFDRIPPSPSGFHPHPDIQGIRDVVCEQHSLGILQSSKISSQVEDALIPSLSSSLPIENPGSPYLEIGPFRRLVERRNYFLRQRYVKTFGKRNEST